LLVRGVLQEISNKQQTELEYRKWLRKGLLPERMNNLTDDCLTGENGTNVASYLSFLHILRAFDPFNIVSTHLDSVGERSDIPRHIVQQMDRLRHRC
jgi:hypothetical protein